MSAPCPFCGADASGATCPRCDRLLHAPRRICAPCGKMSPISEGKCCHCGDAFRSELRWKVPLIIALFVLAFIIAFLIEILAR